MTLEKIHVGMVALGTRMLVCVDRSQELNLLERDRARARRKQMGLLASASVEPLEPQTRCRPHYSVRNHAWLRFAYILYMFMRAGDPLNVYAIFGDGSNIPHVPPAYFNAYSTDHTVPPNGDFFAMSPMFNGARSLCQLPKQPAVR